MENQFCIGVYTLQSLCTQKSKLHTKIGEKWRKKNKKKKGRPLFLLPDFFIGALMPTFPDTRCNYGTQ